MSVHRNRAYLANESEGERRFRTAWERLVADLDLEQEYEVGTGRYRLDFAHPPTHSAIEIDGQLGHASPREITRDRRRQRDLEDLGWRFRRFGGLEVMQAPERCVADAAAYLRRRLREQTFQPVPPQARQAPGNGPTRSQHPASSSVQAVAPSARDASSPRAPAACVPPAPALASANAGTTRPRRSRRHLLRLGVLAGGAYLFADLLLTRLLTGEPALPGLPARPQPGQRLYQATWTQGADGWPVGNLWHVRQGLLVSPRDAASLLWAPLALDTTDYAVEATIRILRQAHHPGLVGAGLLVRGDRKLSGYAGMTAFLPGQGATLTVQALHAAAFDLERSAQRVAITDLASGSPLCDGLWHRYRFEANDIELAFWLDGVPLVRVLDSTYPSGRAVGLITCGCQIAVRQFTVTAI